MKLVFPFFLVLAFSFSSTAQSKKPVIVVELFTSEGCSSCPSADRLLSAIVAASYENAEVIGLSFHVDYWDYIGWKDPYANSDYTIRQRVYARKFGLNSIYTPQMIVNGKHEFVGSSKSEWKKAFDIECKPTSKGELEISIISKTKTELTIAVKSKDQTSSQINVAIVEKNLSQDVKRGENIGRKLEHDNVVRSFDTRSFDGKENRFKLNLPEDLKIEDASLIVYSQKEGSWKINGAKKIKLSSLK